MKKENTLTSFLLIIIIVISIYYLKQGSILETNYSLLSQKNYWPLLLFGICQSSYYFIVNKEIKTNNISNYLTLIFCIFTFIIPYNENNALLSNLHIFFGYLAFLFTNVCFIENLYYAHLISLKPMILSSIIMYGIIAFFYLLFMHVNTLLETIFFTSIDLIYFFSINKLKTVKNYEVNYET